MCSQMQSKENAFIILWENFRRGLKGSARAYREDIFYDNIAKMVSESAEAVKWLQTNHKLLWYRCAFNPEIKCDYITSNIVESFNN